MTTPKLLASAALALALAAPARAQDAGTVVATVNGTDITLGELIVARSQLPAQYQGLGDDVLFSSLVDQLVSQQLFADELDEVPPALEYTMTNQERSLRAGEVVNRIAQGAVTDQAVQDAYEAQFANAEPATEFNASHILVETEDAAREIIAEVAGGADFAAVARERSTGPSGPSGGELGWFGPGQMVAPFEDAVVGMEPGAISEPVQTQFGWHVIRLNDTRTQEPPTLAEMRPQLEAQLQQQAVEERLTELSEQAEITRPAEGAFDPALLSDTSLLGD